MSVCERDIAAIWWLSAIAAHTSCSPSLSLAYLYGAFGVLPRVFKEKRDCSCDRSLEQAYVCN